MCEINNVEITRENLFNVAKELGINTKSRNIWDIISDLLYKRARVKSYLKGLINNNPTLTNLTIKNINDICNVAWDTTMELSL